LGLERLWILTLRVSFEVRQVTTELRIIEDRGLTQKNMISTEISARQAMHTISNFSKVSIDINT
jgi:hypothetical protein